MRECSLMHKHYPVAQLRSVAGASCRPGNCEVDLKALEVRAPLAGLVDRDLLEVPVHPAAPAAPVVQPVPVVPSAR